MLMIRRFSSSSGRVLRMVNPATEEIVEFEHPADDKASVAAKFASAKKAQEDWGRRSNMATRLACLERFAALLESPEVQAQGAKLYSLDMGKPFKQARNEIKSDAARVRFFLQHVESAMLTRESPTSSASTREELAWEPLGVVANIAPWNYLYFCATNVLAPALLTGSAVLFKPSEHVLRSGAYLSDLLLRAGVPPGVLQPVWGGADTAQALLSHSLDGVFFTGSVPTGHKVARAMADRFVKVQLELGGKDGFYVAADADVDAAAAALADGAMYNTGQSCCSVERIYAHEAVYDRFVDALGRETAKLGAMGDPLLDETYFGPLARREQVAVVRAQVEEALRMGARDVLPKGSFSVPKRGFYVAPAVLADCTQAMQVMREETFGPVVGVAKVASDEEAVKMINDSQYGLTGGIYTKDEKRARAVLDKLQVGSAMWNACDRVSPGLPWSGRKDSGVGATLGTVGIETFLRPKAYHLRK